MSLGLDMVVDENCFMSLRLDVVFDENFLCR